LKAKQKALLAYSLAEEKRAQHLVILDLRRLVLFTDYFLICQGRSDIQIRAIVDAIIQGLEEKGVARYGMEGYPEAKWVLIDYGDLMVHVFAPEEREFYNLERLWGDAEQLAPPEDKL